jgi:hypothetical protein
VDRPKIDDKCSTCGHLFGGHYVTFDNKIAGCSMEVKMEGSCSCAGYTIKYTPMSTYSSQSDRDYGYDH